MGVSDPSVERHNPYAPPATAAPPRVTATKSTRVNLINRRATAVLLELGAWKLTFGTLLHAVLRQGVVPLDARSVGLSFLITATYWLVRDLLRTADLAKRMVGLRLESDRPRAERPTGVQRLVRNLPFLVPGFSILEYFVAYRDDDGMHRLGDQLAGTVVRDVGAERFGRGSFTWPLVGALVFNWIAAFLGSALLGALVRG